LDCDVPETLVIAVVGLDMVDRIGGPDQTLGQAVLAQWLGHQLPAAASAPSSIVVGAAPVIAALASALGMGAGGVV
jgi:hypothetical protein